MTDKEKIRAEIESQLKIKDRGYSTEDAEYGYRDALEDILRFIDTLPEESVSKDLEEAAINAAMEDMCDRQIMECSSDERLRYSRIFRRGFKAGANWKEKQMMKDATERTVHIHEDLCPYIRRYELAFDIKTQVPDIKEGDKVKMIIIKEDEQ